MANTGNNLDSGVSHWVSGKDAWKLGVSGFLVRARGYVLQIALAIPLMGVPFWWSAVAESEVTISIQWGVFALLLMLAIIAQIAYVRSRKNARRLLQIKSDLHQLAHLLRDFSGGFVQRHCQRINGAPLNGPLESSELKRASGGACDAIAALVSSVTGDLSVGATIRLAFDDPYDNKDETEFVTVGRSRNLNRLRREESEPLSKGDGPLKLLEVDKRVGHGVLFYKNIEKAVLAEVYKRTENHRLYGYEFQSMVVVPLNGWNGQKFDIIGILCVTSEVTKVIDPKQTDLYKSLGDTLASFFSSNLALVGPIPST